jgi:hypothetical protein
MAIEKLVIRDGYFHICGHLGRARRTTADIAGKAIRITLFSPVENRGGPILRPDLSSCGTVATRDSLS